jgi:transmembrane sensor
MTAFRDLSPEQQKRLEEAADWRLKLTRDPSLGSSSEYRQWCSDRHNTNSQEAVGSAWSMVGALENAPEMLELRRQALVRLRRAGTRRWGSRKTKFNIAAAALVIAAIGATALYQHFWGSIGYKTDVGERRVVALPDGSRISMDSDTRVRVAYDKSARSITLERGRSHFDVTHDASRPFTVTAGSQTVVAVGTSFDVERLPSTVLITLIQGQVVIKGAPAATSMEASIALKPGEELIAAPNAQPIITTADLQVARAWEAGRLLFRDEPLGDAVARVNRYTAHPVKIDPSIASIRISGVFNAGDIGSFVSGVTSYFPVKVATTAGNNILLQPR